MTVRSKAHCQAVTDLLELMNLAFMVALLADACWVLRDISIQGATIGLVLIASSLWIGFSLVCYGFIKYHNKQVKAILSSMTRAKLEECKTRNRIKRKLSK
jgi:hypothetical protein